MPHLDIPQDHAFVATLYHFAHKHNIKYILNGGNFATECVRNPLEWLYYGTDMAQLRDIHRRFRNHPAAHLPVQLHPVPQGPPSPIRGVQVVKTAEPAALHEGAREQDAGRNLRLAPHPQKHFESRFTRFYEGYWRPRGSATTRARAVL